MFLQIIGSRKTVPDRITKSFFRGKINKLIRGIADKRKDGDDKGIKQVYSPFKMLRIVPFGLFHILFK